MASSILGKLDTTPQKAVKRIKKFIHSCRPVFTFDDYTGNPKVSLELSPKAEENTLKEIFDYLNSSEKRCYIAIEQILSELTFTYIDILNAYTLSQINLLRAIAKEGCVKEILSGDFISKHKLKASSSVASALKTLIANELVYKTLNGYIIYDRFLGEWLQTH